VAPIHFFLLLAAFTNADNCAVCIDLRREAWIALMQIAVLNRQMICVLFFV
jgi:hypothetical protein